jgi:3-hydroxyacyl-[acyl-carrier-protein] dehydratase
MRDLVSALALLPHGPEFRFVDKLLSLAPGKAAQAHYRVRDEFCEHGAGGKRTFPSMLLVEAGAQVAGVIAQNDPDFPELPGLKLAALKLVEFHGDAAPGDLLEIEASLTARLGLLIQASAKISVAGRDLMTADFTLSGTMTPLAIAPAA